MRDIDKVAVERCVDYIERERRGFVFGDEVDVRSGRAAGDAAPHLKSSAVHATTSEYHAWAVTVMVRNPKRATISGKCSERSAPGLCPEAVSDRMISMVVVFELQMAHWARRCLELLFS